MIGTIRDWRAGMGVIVTDCGSKVVVRGREVDDRALPLQPGDVVTFYVVSRMAFGVMLVSPFAEAQTRVGIADHDEEHKRNRFRRE